MDKLGSTGEPHRLAGRFFHFVAAAIPAGLLRSTARLLPRNVVPVQYSSGFSEAAPNVWCVFVAKAPSYHETCADAAMRRRSFERDLG